ncbi:MAG: accessory factor UbiK family protein [Rhodospirillales bacterium]|jgi:hypothetical protein|nr:accessory factor UbiK family protein [Rhodospirillales bacterium]
MQTNNRFLDDLAKVASGAASTFVGVKQEVDAIVRQRIERLIHDFDLVSRDEFEAIKATAVATRSAQEALEQRVAELEARLAAADEATPDVGADASTTQTANDNPT